MTENPVEMIEESEEEVIEEPEKNTREYLLARIKELE